MQNSGLRWGCPHHFSCYISVLHIIFCSGAQLTWISVQRYRQTKAQLWCGKGVHLDCAAYLYRRQTFPLKVTRASHATAQALLAALSSGTRWRWMNTQYLFLITHRQCCSPLSVIWIFLLVVQNLPKLESIPVSLPCCLLSDGLRTPLPPPFFTAASPCWSTVPKLLRAGQNNRWRSQGYTSGKQ